MRDAMNRDAKKVAIVKIMVADSYLRGRVSRDEVEAILGDLRDDEPDVMAKSSLVLVILGLVAIVGLLGWIMAIR